MKASRSSKKTSGFTLVELIVVLVILATLAALLVPSLTGYIDKARQNAVISKARAVLVASQAVVTEAYADGKLVLDKNGVGYSELDKDTAHAMAKEIMALAEITEDECECESEENTMKETIKTSRTAGYLEKIFRALNAKYFNGELEEPIITIQSTPRAYGHVTVAKAWQRGDTTRHELNIGAGTLARPIENVVASTLHECVHLWNIQNGIQDCSRGGQYHNKKFKYAAEARDLKISYDSRIGWSITEPTEALCEFILEQGWEDIRMNRIEWSYTTKGKGAGSSTGSPAGASPNSHSIKYMCPCCKNSVRATKVVNIKCADCDVLMVAQQ